MGFGFHSVMVDRIMTCVASTSFSININGCTHGYFKGKRGLRQGDPLSPYLFTLVMEVLTLILQQKVQQSSGFSYHKGCDEQRIVNLCFADDLFLFARGDVASVNVLMEGLNTFKEMSGLVPSVQKSTAYFCNVAPHVKHSILLSMPFEEGKLPVKYLGVPLISSRLVYKDCKGLLEKVINRLGDWKNKSLSFAGRLQLILSVLSSMHVYWASVFILPSRVIAEIEQLMRGFLWCQGDMKRGKAKVAWDSVCLPKAEGGLGIRKLESFNIALMAFHIWSLLTHRESLWVKWIHTYKLRGRSFWDIPIRAGVSWGWRKLLQIREVIRPFIWFRVGNGNITNVWFDNWCPSSPLITHLSPRSIMRAGFSLHDKLVDVIHDGVWKWPSDWIHRFPVLNSVSCPSLSSVADSIVWSDHVGVKRDFMVTTVWDTIRSGLMWFLG